VVSDATKSLAKQRLGAVAGHQRVQAAAASPTAIPPCLFCTPAGVFIRARASTI